MEFNELMEPGNDKPKDESKNEYLDLLNQKLEHLLNMLKATETEKFTGEGSQEQLEEEADRFSDLYEHRANIITSIEKIDEALGLKQMDSESDKAFSAARNEILEKIRETAKTLIELDKKNLEASKKITDFLKGNLKKMREGRGINTAYSDPSQSSSGNYFDQKN